MTRTRLLNTSTLGAIRARVERDGATVTSVLLEVAPTTLRRALAGKPLARCVAVRLERTL